MKKLFYFRSGVWLLALTILSCDTQLLDYPDPNSKNVDAYFNTPSEIEQGAVGIYSAFFHNNAFPWQLPEMFDGLANEFQGRPSSTSETDIQALLRYQHTNSTGPILSYWRLLYRMIMRSNLVLFKGSQYEEKNGKDILVSSSMGDAYFLRGWAYSQLAFHWGDVPLRASYIFVGAGDAPRISVEKVWQQSEADFKEAQNLLPAAWGPEFLGRATKGAATAFLGKLYLYTKEYTKAEAEFEKLEGNYSLLPGDRWDDNFGEFNENNDESVFEIQCADIPGTDPFASILGDPEGSGNPGRQNGHAQLYSWTDWANWAFQPRRVSDFQYTDEDGKPYIDPRAELTFYGGIGDQTWCDNCPTGAQSFDFATYGYWYRKHTNKENKPSEEGALSGNNIRLMRYADVLLMRAECRIKLGSVSDAIGLINQVRSRISAFAYTQTYTQEQAFELLKRERQLEFMGEQIRYNDLKRWGILKETMNIELQAMFGFSNVDSKHELFPIPRAELDTNKELIVNDSWN